MAPIELEGAASPADGRCAPAAGLRSAVTPEVGLDDPAVVADRFRGTLGELPAVVEDGDAVREPHHHAHVVLDEEDRDAGVADLPDELGQHGRLVRVGACRRLVEEQQPRLGGKRAGDLETALRAVGQLSGQRVRLRRQADPLEERHTGPLRLELLAPG
jgi:hypothetical protein